ncbi:MAG: dihydropteroate synthase [Angustibacter sp.]
MTSPDSATNGPEVPTKRPTASVQAAPAWVVTPDLGPNPLRHFGSRSVDLTYRTLVMAIVNRTRDSFVDQGATFAWDAALRAVDRAVADGADWVDIGGVPFSSLAHPVSEQEEVDLVVPLVAAARSRSDVVLSVDTSRATVARESLRAGADVINDTSALSDPQLAREVAEHDGTLVVCHSRGGRSPEDSATTRDGHPTYQDVVRVVRDVLVQRAADAIGLGVPPERIVVDPGHDLHKNTWHSLELTRRLDEFASLGYPLLAAVSTKDFIQESLGLAKDAVLAGTTATHVICMLRGARILRVHDVPAAVRAARMTEAILGWRAPVQLRHNMPPTAPLPPSSAHDTEPSR